MKIGDKVKIRNKNFGIITEISGEFNHPKNTLYWVYVEGEGTYCFYISDLELVKEQSNEDWFIEAYESLARMQIAKDEKYGNSALKPLEIFSHHHTYGSRIDEKLARVKYSDELRKNDVADIIGGLMLICKDKGWSNFEDLID